MAGNLPQPTPADLESLGARVAEVQRMAADLQEAFRRLSEATGVPLLPVPSSPRHRHLWPVPSLPA